MRRCCLRGASASTSKSTPSSTRASIRVTAQTVGIGAGQMSRSTRRDSAAMKAILPLARTVAASDAFFPFADGLETVGRSWCDCRHSARVGRLRDAEVIEAADRLGVAMVFTGIRHFRHGLDSPGCSNAFCLLIFSIY